MACIKKSTYNGTRSCCRGWVVAAEGSLLRGGRAIKFLLDLRVQQAIFFEFTLERELHDRTMKIRFEDIPADGLQLNFFGDEDILPVSLCGPVVPGGPQIGRRITGRLDIVPDGKKVLVTGALSGRLRLQCARCLADFSADTNIEVDLVVSSGDLADEFKVTAEELDDNAVIVEGAALDTDEIIAQEFLLAAPMKPLCDENCPGLCPRCGQLKGSPACTCGAEEATDPRWAVLARLKDEVAP